MKLKKVFLLILVVIASICVIGNSKLTEVDAEDVRTIYFVPSSNWKSDSARFAAYCWVGEDNKWYDFNSENDQYKTDISTKYEKIIYCRMNPETKENNWSNKWNQTADQSIPSDKNRFTVNSGEWDNATGTWDKYTPEVEDKYSVKIGEVTKELTVNQNATIVENQTAEYMIIAVAVNSGDTVEFFLNGTKIAKVGTGEDSNNNIKVTENEDLKVVTGGTIDIYFKIWNDGGYSVWASGYASTVLSKLGTGDISASLSFDYSNSESDYYYFTRASDWDVDTMYCYAFNSNDNNNNTWPGIAMEYEGTNTSSQHVYRILKSKVAEYENLVFNNGIEKSAKDQTEDIKLSEHDGKNAFYCEGDKQINNSIDVYPVKSRKSEEKMTDYLFYSVELYFKVANTNTVTVTSGTATINGFKLYISNGNPNSIVNTEKFNAGEEIWTTALDVTSHESAELTVTVKAVMSDASEITVGEATISAKEMASKYIANYSSNEIVSKHREALTAMSNK